MKNYRILLFLVLLSFTSCMDVIDKPNISTIGDDMWNNYEIAQMYLDELYANSLPASSWGVNMNNTDEAYGSSATDLLYGSASIGTESSYSTTFWHRIRYINIMLEEMPRLSTLSQDEQSILLAQARFLRAVEYWQIVRMYGGIAIQTKAIDINTDEDNLPRATTKECVDFIISDLDYAASKLPDSWITGDPTNANLGRLTRLAALAYKGRVLLHFASPMFTERDAYVSNDGTSIAADSIAHESKVARWDSAYKANKYAYDELVAKGYGLMPSFSDASTVEALTNTEAVMVRLYTGRSYTHNWDARIRPTSQNGTGHNINPAWELATAFPTKEGKGIYETGSGYLDKYYWINRDPRFYKTLVYNGMVWDISTTTNRKQWCYVGTNSETSIPFSGFYCCKGQDKTLTADNLSLGKTDWKEIRLAEVMLNLAESALETGHMDETVTLVRAIRKRAGILEGTDASKAYGVADNLTYIKMLDLLMKERLIEFAFENQRYWDLRRRMMYTRDLSPTTLKLNGTRRRGVDNSVSSTKKMPDNVTLVKTWLLTNKDTLTLTTTNYYNYFLSFFLKKLDNNPNVTSLGINYKPDYYFLPIPDNMFLNSSATLQTLGWSSGTFDPIKE
jgi:starch-binding outer membrane protein, SusD/RagB family